MIEYGETEKLNIDKDNQILIKGISYKYIILNENNIMTIRYEKNLDIIKAKKAKNENEANFIVYNCHILVPEKNTIVFYSIPDLISVSIIKVTEQIYSFLIPNKNIFLLIGNNSIEQLELNTWKRVSKYINRDLFDFPKKNQIIIGNNKELYLFENGEIYKFLENP